MGMPLREFMPMWALMMTAMMLPAVAPVASLYSRTIGSDRSRRLVLFVGGYLIVWTGRGHPAYARSASSITWRLIRDTTMRTDRSRHPRRRRRCIS